MSRTACRLILILLLILWPALGHAGIREPILAGSWYPEDKDLLRRTVESYLSDDSVRASRGAESPIALIVPHAGYRFSGPTAGRGYATVRGRTYERVILIGPSHRVSFDGVALPPSGSWRTPLGDVALDEEAIASLAARTGFARLPEAHEKEHCLEIQLPFLQVALEPGFRLVPLVIGRMDAEGCKNVADGLSPLLGASTLLVVSSDFTHYGPNYDYVPFREDVGARIKELDERAAASIQTLSPTAFEEFCARTQDTICGREPIRILLTMLQGRDARAATLGYARSGDLMGDFTNSVSYLAIAFLPSGDGGGGEDATDRETRGVDPTLESPRMLDSAEKAFLLKLARGTIAAKLRGTKPPSSEVPSEFSKDSPLREVRGVFVTLNEDGNLRGCIGSIFGEEPLAEGVARQAINSAFHDPRFSELRPEELDSIEIEISVLTPPTVVAGYESVVVGRHGVLLEKNGHRAVFLPQVAPEQGWDRDTMLRHLCRKAGLGPEDWRTGASFEVFEAQILEEKPAR
jgi:MEMO1 family protein